MKNSAIFLSAIFIILASGCVGSQQTTGGGQQGGEQKTIIDCGTDTTCFSNNFKTCTPAKFMGGLSEIMGGSPASCQIFMQSEDMGGGKRLTMLCDVKNTDTFKESEMNGYGISIQKGASCTGTLYDFYKKL